MLDNLQTTHQLLISTTMDKDCGTRQHDAHLRLLLAVARSLKYLSLAPSSNVSSFCVSGTPPKGRERKGRERKRGSNQSRRSEYSRCSIPDWYSVHSPNCRVTQYLQRWAINHITQSPSKTKDPKAGRRVQVLRRI